MKYLGKIQDDKDLVTKEYVDKKLVLDSKTFTEVIGTENNWANATFFFGSIHPAVWNEYWRIKYKIRVYVPGQTNYNQMADVMISGRAGDFKAYYSLNTIGAYYVCYYHELYRLKEAGFNSGYGHSVGVRFYSAYNPISTNYKRTIEVEITETENCSFEFYDSCYKYAEIPGTGSTNYNTYTEMDFVNNGLRETGDDNDVNYYNRTYYSSRTTNAALYRYMYCLTKSDGSLVPVNSENNVVATTKTLTTDSFDPFGEIFYSNTTATYAAGAIIGNNILYRQFLADLRYAFNVGGYNVASTLTARLPLYLVAVPQSDGLAKLYSSPLSQTLPTTDDGLIYIYLGRVYEDTYPYRCALTFNHPVYWYKNGAVRPYGDYGHSILSDVPANAKFTDTTYTGTSPITVSGTAISHANSGVTAASKGDTANQTPGFGSTFKVPSGTVNATGHMTAFADHTVKIPDTKASTSAYGITKLSTATNSTATDVAATSSAVKTAYDLADEGKDIANQALSGVNGSLIYDHTYTISNGVATFTPHVYCKGEEVTSQYAASCFSWKYRLDNNVTGTPSYVNLTTDSTTKGCTVTISTLGYGGHVIGTFTPPA